MIGGDGIGPEVVAQALDVVAAAGVTLETKSFDLGAARFLRDGEVLSDETLEELRGFDAILLGAIGPALGDTRIPGGTLERGLLLRLRFALDTYINLRPFVGMPGSLAEGCEFVVIRENTEGAYAGEGGSLRRGTPFEVATQGSVNTRHGVERCVRFYNHVDAACIHLVERPERYDIIVTDNLFGDILTDLAGAVSGGIGYAPSANLNPAGTGPSVFEPVHGAAHDIAGSNKANPIAAIWSAALMVDALGEHEAAARITEAALDEARSARSGESPTTDQIGRSIIERLGNRG